MAIAAPAHSRARRTLLPQELNTPVLHLILCPDKSDGHGGGQAAWRPVYRLFNEISENYSPTFQIDAGKPGCELTQ